MSLTKEALLSALPRTKDYTLTGEHSLKGEKVTLRALSGAHYTEWLACEDPTESRVILIAGGLAEPELGPEDAEKIANLEATLVIELTNAIAAFAGLIAAPTEEAAEPEATFRK